MREESPASIDIIHPRPDAVLLPLPGVLAGRRTIQRDIPDLAGNQPSEGESTALEYNQKQRALTSSQEQTEGKECRP